MSNTILVLTIAVMVLQSDPGMALIPGGEFWMGRNHSFLFDELNWTLRPRLDDRPVHQINLDAFYMDKYEVTNAEYQRFTEATRHEKPWHWPGGKVTSELEKSPVYNVSWHDAQAYCTWVDKRLPTEAEWEKAARGGLDRKLYAWGDNPVAVRAPFDGAAATTATAAATTTAATDEQPAAKEPKRGHWGFPNGPAPVGSYPANGYGLYDMTGNVWEWVADWYEKDYYLESPEKNPQGPASAQYKVARGAGWSSTEDLPQRSILGVHYRNYADPSDKSNVLGFRCAKSVENFPKPN